MDEEDSPEEAVEAVELDNDVINVASETSPILTRTEPEFRRFFARGSLLRIQDYDEETVQLGFWSFKDENVPIEDEDEVTATGYRLEAEAMMTWSTADRLRKLLNNYIEENAPEEFHDNDD